MDIEIKVEGAIIRGVIERTPVYLTGSAGPGLILMGHEESADVEAYRYAVGLAADGRSADLEQIVHAKDRMATDPDWADELANVLRLGEGSPWMERSLLLALRCLGEPYAVPMELHELVTGAHEWGLPLSMASSPKKRFVTHALWVPDEALYGEMVVLARIFASCDLQFLRDDGRYLAGVRGGESHVFDNRSDAFAWLDTQAVIPLRAYTPKDQAMAMTRAAWERSQEAIDRLNAIINVDTYTARATVHGPNGEISNECTLGLIGQKSAGEALMALIERVHPTAFPMPRFH